MHDEFLTALRANPNDDVTRLVYADYLEEQSDPLSEFLRLEVWAAADGLPDDEHVELANRLAELGRAAEPRWLVAVNRTPFVRCVLRRRMGGSPLDGTLELANYSSQAMLVTTSPHVLQYLFLTITAPLGDVTSGPYAEYGLPRLSGLNAVLRLTPGERTSVRVNLLNLIPPAEVTVGTYAVEASFVYDRVTSRADAVRVELTDDDRRKWKLGRYARE
jgi:uncharacterized protein (TIGR02996 family)